MIILLIILLIISIILNGYIYRENLHQKKEISYYRENDRLKDDLKETSENPNSK